MPYFLQPPGLEKEDPTWETETGDVMLPSYRIIIAYIRSYKSFSNIPEYLLKLLPTEGNGNRNVKYEMEKKGKL